MLCFVVMSIMKETKKSFYVNEHFNGAFLEYGVSCAIL